MMEDLREARLGAGLSQTVVATRVGLSRSRLSRDRARRGIAGPRRGARSTRGRRRHRCDHPRVCRGSTTPRCRACSVPGSPSDAARLGMGVANQGAASIRGDQRAWDAVGVHRRTGLTVWVEVETQLRDSQAILQRVSSSDTMAAPLGPSWWCGTAATTARHCARPNGRSSRRSRWAFAVRCHHWSMAGTRPETHCSCSEVRSARVPPWAASPHLAAERFPTARSERRRSRRGGLTQWPDSLLVGSFAAEPGRADGLSSSRDGFRCAIRPPRGNRGAGGSSRGGRGPLPAVAGMQPAAGSAIGTRVLHPAGDGEGHRHDRGGGWQTRHASHRRAGSGRRCGWRLADPERAGQ